MQKGGCCTVAWVLKVCVILMTSVEEEEEEETNNRYIGLLIDVFEGQLLLLYNRHKKVLSQKYV